MDKKQKYKTIWEEVALDLRDKILRGDIGQGERIKEAEIAEEFGISRGPVREAFRQLEKEGLIDYSSRKGCTVKLISATDSAEFYILRASLENLSVRLARGNFSDETIKGMQKTVEEMEKYQNVENLPQIIRLDQQFHEQIVRECGMKKLVEMWNTLNNANAIIFYALYHTRYSPRELFSENHRDLIEVLQEGDVEKTCAGIQEHYLIVAKNLYRKENKEFSDTGIWL